MNSTTQTMTLEVYDPAMCCSTGVCGPDVDQNLVDFSTDVKWLKSQGIDVQRFNLGQEPEAFKANIPVITKVQKEGSDCLPILLVNGEIVAEGGYPDREQLKQLLGISDQPKEVIESRYDEITDILVGIGAAVAAGSQANLTSHFKRGEQLGLSKDDLAKAMQKGLNVNQSATSDLVETANSLLGIQSNCTPGGGCC